MSVYKPQIWHFLLFLGLFYTSHLLASPPPGWQVNPAAYSNSMIIVGAINISKTESLDANDKVAAFIDGECRGVAGLSYFAEVDRYLAYLFIYSNGVIGEEISFKLYDASADQVFDVPKTEDFESNGSIGDALKPYVFANVPLSSEASITGFSVAEQEGSTNIEGTNISFQVGFGTDFSQLRPEFIISDGASAWVGETAQESGVTINDFSQPVVYTIRSEDEQIFVDYTVTISEAFAKPSDIQMSDSVMNENLPLNAVIAEFTTLDLDDKTHVYSLVSGEGDTDNAKFKISENKLLTRSKFDYELAAAYDFRVKSSDDEGNTIEKDFTFTLNDLNDNAPLAEDTLLKVDEGKKVNTLLYDIEATDADGVGGLFFTILSGNESGSFMLDKASGELRIAKEPDYEETTQYLLEVELNDSVNTSLVYLDIWVNDLNDEIPQMEVDSLLEIPETWATNQLITTIQATDADADTKLVYGIASGNEKGWIAVNEENGQISLAKEVEYIPEENTDSVEVSISDGVHTVTSTIYLEIEDINAKPVVRNSTYVVDEDEETLIGELSASDLDRHQTLTYSFLDGDTLIFSISDSGIITLTEAGSLDYETQTLYEFDVVVRDNGIPMMGDTASIRIEVNDLNDEIPQIEVDSLLEISEFWAVDQLLTTITATDADANTQLVYGIASGNEEGWISVNEENGQIRLAQEVEYIPEANTDIVQVSVSDGLHTVTSLVYLEINDINSKPVMRDSIFYIDEDAEVETLIAELVATDLDRHQSLNFSFLDGDTTNFYLSDDGLLSLALEDALDYETQSLYEFDVVVRDNGVPVMGDTARIRIEVNDVIEDVLPAVNTMTPNGDGFNDYWVIDNVEIYEGFELHIFNSRGNIVYESYNYQNDWDGTYQGAPLPGGVYYYLFKNQEKQYQGTITLIK